MVAQQPEVDELILQARPLVAHNLAGMLVQEAVQVVKLALAQEHQQAETPEAMSPLFSLNQSTDSKVVGMLAQLSRHHFKFLH